MQLGKKQGGRCPLGKEVSNHEVQVPTSLTPDMVSSTPVFLLELLRSGLGWAPGVLILSSTYIWAFLLSTVPGQMRVPSEGHQSLCVHRSNPVKVPSSPLSYRLFSSPCAAGSLDSLAQGKRQGQAGCRRGMQQNPRASHLQFTHIFFLILTLTLRGSRLWEAMTCPKSRTN